MRDYQGTSTIAGHLTRRSVLLSAASMTALPGLTQISSAAGDGDEAMVLHYRQPAMDWNEALPLGNGRLGAMVFGGQSLERIQLNDDTLYSGEPGQRDLPLDVSVDFAKVVRMIADERYAEAEERIRQRWLGRVQGCYQPLADLWIETHDTGSPGVYRRTLDLDQAISTVEFRAAGGTIRREAFASYPARCLVLRISGLNAGQMVRVRLSSPHPARLEHTGRGEILLRGQLPGLVMRRTLRQVEERGETWKYPELWTNEGTRREGAAQILYGERAEGLGTRFACLLSVSAGRGSLDVDAQGVRISADGDIVLLLTSGSSFDGPFRSPSKPGKDEVAEARVHLAFAQGKDFETLRREHVADYQKLFHRVKLRLGKTGEMQDAPTDERLLRNQTKHDPGLAVLYFQFGRYLMIAGSRKGSQPLNLQGIWNEHVIPPWAGAYTININTEMNYWPAEVTNLSECAEPLLRMVEELAVDGRKVAKQMYQRPGWVAHHNTTIWRDAQPVDGGTRASFWPMGAGWLLAHVWEHFLYSGDVSYLRDHAYPLLRGASEFFLAWLKPDANGMLQTPVGTSPENAFFAIRNGKREAVSVSPSPTCDIATIREIFRALLGAAAVLEIDGEVERGVMRAMGRLPDFQIGSHGELLEWDREREEAEPEHRHVSHLYGLHPGSQIRATDTPEAFAAAARSLERRGDGGTGWAMAWKVNLWARLGNGNRAWRLYQNLIQPARLPGSNRLRGGAMPNLMCAHPPFQIDGNFGGTAGLAEMLLQSHEGDVHLLPALPDAWPDGSVIGLRARGDFTVAMTWGAGKLRSAEIAAGRAGVLRVRYRGRRWETEMRAGERVDAAPHVAQSP